MDLHLDAAKIALGWRSGRSGHQGGRGATHQNSATVKRNHSWFCAKRKIALPPPIFGPVHNAGSKNSAPPINLKRNFGHLLGANLPKLQKIRCGAPENFYLGGPGALPGSVQTPLVGRGGLVWTPRVRRTGRTPPTKFAKPSM